MLRTLARSCAIGRSYATVPKSVVARALNKRFRELPRVRPLTRTEEAVREDYIEHFSGARSVEEVCDYLLVVAHDGRMAHRRNKELQDILRRLISDLDGLVPTDPVQSKDWEW